MAGLLGHGPTLVPKPRWAVAQHRRADKPKLPGSGMTSPHTRIAEIRNEVLTIDFLGWASVDFGIGPLETLAWKVATSSVSEVYLK